MLNNTPGKLYIISAPSGTGKTSLVKQILAEDPQLRVSISHTTRLMRPKEQDKINYYFVSDEQFDEMIQQQAFLEHAHVHQYRYGTSRHYVHEQLSKGLDVLLEIDWQGAQQIREKIKDTVSIFILPPSFAALSERMTERKQDSQATITQRLKNAHEELKHYREFDYLVVNKDFEKAVFELRSIITAQRLLYTHASHYHAELIEELLKEREVV